MCLLRCLYCQTLPTPPLRWLWRSPPPLPTSCVFSSLSRPPMPIRPDLHTTLITFFSVLVNFMCLNTIKKIIILQRCLMLTQSSRNWFEMWRPTHRPPQESFLALSSTPLWHRPFPSVPHWFPCWGYAHPLSPILLFFSNYCGSVIFSALPSCGLPSTLFTPV